MPPKRSTSTKRKAVAKADSGSDSPVSPPGEDFDEAVEDEIPDMKLPAKKKATSSKRKAVDRDDEPEASGSKSKKAKTAKVAKGDPPVESGSGLAPNGQPTNKVLPVKIEFAPKHSDAIRIAAYNICGLAASSRKVRII